VAVVMLQLFNFTIFQVRQNNKRTQFVSNGAVGFVGTKVFAMYRVVTEDSVTVQTSLAGVLLQVDITLKKSTGFAFEKQISRKTFVRKATGAHPTVPLATTALRLVSVQ
jgi:hypothetical protein